MSDTNLNDANFTPTIPDSEENTNQQTYSATGSFRFWCQKVLPLVYDDSLSYYELLCKVVNYLNNVIQNVDNLNTSVTNTNTAFDNLQDYVNDTKDSLILVYSELEQYVNDYFNNLDVQNEINTKLDEMASDGSLSGVVSPFIPSVVSDWLSHNITPTSPAIDASLSVSGAGADAKVTGDKLSNIKTNLNNINGAQIKTNQIDYSYLTISENKKITGYDASTFVPLLADESDSFVADIAISDIAQYSTVKFPRCSKSSQWFILYSNSQGWNFLNTNHTKTNNYDLSNDDYGIINCKWLATTSYTRIVIAFDSYVDITIDSQFDTFFDLMDSVKKNDSASVDIRKLYYASTIDITKQATSTYVPFVINSGETLTFKNNTSGDVSLYAIDVSNNRTLITNGVTSGRTVTFTAEQDFIQILYWAQQLGSVSVVETDSVIYQLENAINNSNIASVNMFSSIAAIGDSYTAGSTRNSAGTWKDYRNLSWIATLGKRTGTEWKNYGHGGATTKSFLETTEFANSLSDTACDLYFFALGQNDGNQALTIGTVADIHDADYTQNPETFYGCYGKIIQQIKNHAPNAKLVMITNWVMGSTWTDYDVAIRAIANHYSIPVIEPFDDYFFNSALYQDYNENGHPTAMGYSSMGIAMERLFSKCVIDNPSYFKFSTIG